MPLFTIGGLIAVIALAFAVSWAHRLWVWHQNKAMYLNSRGDEFERGSIEWIVRGLSDGDTALQVKMKLRTGKEHMRGVEVRSPWRSTGTSYTWKYEGPGRFVSTEEYLVMFDDEGLARRVWRIVEADWYGGSYPDYIDLSTMRAIEDDDGPPDDD